MSKEWKENEEALRLAGKELKVGFREVETVDHYLGKDDITGYQYTLNGRTYTDVSSFHAGDRQKLEEDVEIRTDIYGSKVLWVYQEIPTFDSDDRDWDSHAVRYLIYDGREIDLIYMRGGYHIAKLKIYKGLQYADRGLKSYLKQLDFPADNIHFQ